MLKNFRRAMCLGFIFSIFLLTWTLNVFDVKAYVSEDEKITPLLEIVVRDGWTLEEIAEGLGMKFWRLVELNQLKNDRIWPGQILKAMPYSSFDEIIVSWYGELFHGKTMSNGEPFDMENVTTCAHKWLPFGTEVRLTRLDTGQSIIVVVKDRGPYVEGRHVDLSERAAEAFNMIHDGIVKCRIEILSQGVSEDLGLPVYFGF